MWYISLERPFHTRHLVVGIICIVGNVSLVFVFNDAVNPQRAVSETAVYFS